MYISLAAPPGRDGKVERIQYTLRGGATEQTHYCSRTFENAVWHSHAVYDALKARPEIRPDLIVAHSGFGSSLFLRELYDCAILNYFEYFYRTVRSDMDFRPDFPCEELSKLRARARNAMLLLDLENCDLGQSPTQWQQARLPAEFRDKVRVVFDGIDTSLWRPQKNPTRQVAGRSIPDDMKVITYVSRGMESMRGFDIFMRMAGQICRRRPDVIFVVVGEDRVCYGGDLKITGTRSFKEWVLSQGHYDLSRFLFTGWLSPPDLVSVFAISDLHVYLTVPFVLSWSLLDALACGATVLASDTAPVREFIRHGENGLLTDFFDIDAMTRQAIEVLDHPADYDHLGPTGTALVQDRYSLDRCLPGLLALYQAAVSKHSNQPAAGSGRQPRPWSRRSSIKPFAPMLAIALKGFLDHRHRVLGRLHLVDLDGLTFQKLVVEEKAAKHLEAMWGEFLCLLKTVEFRVAHRDGKDLMVFLAAVDHGHEADGSRRDQRHRCQRLLTQHQDIQWVIVLGVSLGNESIVRRIIDR